jgi:DNA-binding transcriptional LysR family regulator
MISFEDVHLVATINAATTIRKAQSVTGVHLATLYRRLRDLERRAGGALFERQGNTLVPTTRAQPFLDASDDLTDRLAEVERRVAAQDDRLIGPLKVTVALSLMQTMSSCLLDFHRKHPGVRVALEVNNSQVDLGRREADVAVRLTTTPPETLIGRKAVKVDYGIYQARSRDALPGWVGYEAALTWQAAQWHAENVNEDEVNLRVNVMSGVASAAAAGWGKAVLPSYVAAEYDLVRVGEPLEMLASELWVLFHPDLKGNPRVRKFSDFATGWLRRRLSPGS